MSLSMEFLKMGMESQPSASNVTEHSDSGLFKPLNVCIQFLEVVNVIQYHCAETNQCYIPAMV